MCLFVGQQKQQKLPEGLDGEEEEQDAKVRFERRREREKVRSKGKRKSVKDRDWILKKKEVRRFKRTMLTDMFIMLLQLYRKRGKESVPNDSKYTGRKRKTYF